MKAARPPECSAIKQEQKQGPKLNCPCFFNVFLPLRPGVLLCLRRTGKQREKVLPQPGLLSTRMLPLCAAMTFQQ